MVYKRRKIGTEVDYPHYWYRFKRNGIIIRVNTKQSSKRTAEELESAHRTRLAKGEGGLRDGRDTPTLKKFEPRFTEAIKARCAEKPATIKFYGFKMASLLDFPPLANARLDRIDEALIERFVQHRLKQVSRPGKATKCVTPATVTPATVTPATVTPATVNRAIATLRRAMRLAQEWKIIDRVPRFRMLKGERNREFVLSKQRESEYLGLCPEPLKSMALLILDTGLRLGEAIRLEWRDVHAPGGGAKYGYLQIRHGKSAKAKRSLSLTGRVTELLKTMAKTRTDQFVFSNGGDGKPYRDTHLSHLQQKVRDKLKWSDEFVIHSLRHTFGTRLGESGADVFSIMKIMGHASIAVSQRYVHPTPESLERAFERLETLNAEAEKGVHTVGTQGSKSAGLKL